MDDVVALLLNAKTIYLAFAVIIVTFFVRRIVETAVPAARKAADENSPMTTYPTEFSKWWNQVILYAVPVLVGVGLSLTVDELISDLMKQTSSIVVYGGIVGWSSSFIYKVLRKILKEKTGIELPGASIAPPSSEGHVVVVAPLPPVPSINASGSPQGSTVSVSVETKSESLPAEDAVDAKTPLPS